MEAWEALRRRAAGDPIVEAIYLMTRDLYRQLTVLERKVEGIEQLLAKVAARSGDQR